MWKRKKKTEAYRRAELESVGFFFGETDWVYKAWDKEEAIEMAKVAKEIWKEWSEDFNSKS